MVIFCWPQRKSQTKPISPSFCLFSLVFPDKTAGERPVNLPHACGLHRRIGLGQNPLGPRIGKAHRPPLRRSRCPWWRQLSPVPFLNSSLRAEKPNSAMWNQRFLPRYSVPKSPVSCPLEAELRCAPSPSGDFKTAVPTSSRSGHPWKSWFSASKRSGRTVPCSQLKAPMGGAPKSRICSMNGRQRTRNWRTETWTGKEEEACLDLAKRLNSSQSR